VDIRNGGAQAGGLAIGKEWRGGRNNHLYQKLLIAEQGKHLKSQIDLGLIYITSVAIALPTANCGRRCIRGYVSFVCSERLSLKTQDQRIWLQDLSHSRAVACQRKLVAGDDEIFIQLTIHSLIQLQQEMDARFG
jgi:hypothetical protein